MGFPNFAPASMWAAVVLHHSRQVGDSASDRVEPGPITRCTNAIHPSVREQLAAPCRRFAVRLTCNRFRIRNPLARGLSPALKALWRSCPFRVAV